MRVVSQYVTKSLIIARDNYGYCLLVSIISLCYTALRYTYNYEFNGATYEQIFTFIAPVPFGKRVLTPILANIIVHSGISQYRAFQLIEITSIASLIFALYNIFQLYVEKRSAKVLSLLFICFLPLVFLLRTPFPLLFPWDTPAMTLIAWSIYCLLKAKWKAALGVMLLASLNRESAVLIPLLYTGMYGDRTPIKRFAGYLAMLIAVYISCQYAVGTTLHNNLPFYNLHGGMSLQRAGTWRMLYSMGWLNSSNINWLVLVSSMAGTPLLFLMFIRTLPCYFRRYGLISLAYFVMLSIVGNLFESRIFGETVLILYIPIALAVCSYISNTCVFTRYRLSGEENILSKYAIYMEWVALLVLLIAPVIVYHLLIRMLV